jgi:sulfate adenylyltransferase subunit 1
MVTGASTANAAIILIDARKGLLEQTIRHSYIASLLRINQIIVCVNKMDLVDYSEEVFLQIKKEYESMAAKLNISDVVYIPVSALKGDNVVTPSLNMNWYIGGTMLSVLESIDVIKEEHLLDARFPVQFVIRPMSTEHHDYRGYAGRVAGGVFNKGDGVTVLPSGLQSTIKSIETMDGRLVHAFAPMSITLTLTDDIDVSRGDMIVKSDFPVKATQDIDVMICWLSDKALQLNGKYSMRHTTRDVRCVIKDIIYKMNINTLEEMHDDKAVNLNDIAKITLRTTAPIVIDKYNDNRSTGSIIIIDDATNATVGAGMIV